MTLSLQVYLNSLNSPSIGANMEWRARTELIAEFGSETRASPKASLRIRDLGIVEPMPKVVSLLDIESHKGFQ